MGLPVPSPSALQSFIGNHKSHDDSNHPAYLHQLALQIAHNLRFQHNWIDVRIHHARSDSADASSLPRRMLTGIPPQRLYVHPDEQIDRLQKQKNEGKTGMPELRPEREWVLPSHLREKWSLRRFGEVFDAISATPSREGGKALFTKNTRSITTRPDTSEESDGDVGMDGVSINQWRTTQPKRLLLATLDDDSTIVYYIVHDGIVKPRQN